MNVSMCPASALGIVIPPARERHSLSMLSMHGSTFKHGLRLYGEPASALVRSGVELCRFSAATFSFILLFRVSPILLALSFLTFRTAWRSKTATMQSRCTAKSPF